MEAWLPAIAGAALNLIIFAYFFGRVLERLDNVKQAIERVEDHGTRIALAEQEIISVKEDIARGTRHFDAIFKWQANATMKGHGPTIPILDTQSGET